MALLTAKQIDTIDYDRRSTLKTEQTIARKLVKLALAKGFAVSVNDGEVTTLSRSTSLKDICNALATTDEDHLILYKDDKKVGWVWLIWGNGEDIISDCTATPTIESLVDEVTPP